MRNTVPDEAASTHAAATIIPSTTPQKSWYRRKYGRLLEGTGAIVLGLIGAGVPEALRPRSEPSHLTNPGEWKAHFSSSIESPRSERVEKEAVKRFEDFPLGTDMFDQLCSITVRETEMTFTTLIQKTEQGVRFTVNDHTFSNYDQLIGKERAEKLNIPHDPRTLIGIARNDGDRLTFTLPAAKGEITVSPAQFMKAIDIQMRTLRVDRPEFIEVDIERKGYVHHPELKLPAHLYFSLAKSMKVKLAVQYPDEKLKEIKVH